MIFFSPEPLPLTELLIITMTVYVSINVKHHVAFIVHLFTIVFPILTDSFFLGHSEVESNRPPWVCEVEVKYQIRSNLTHIGMWRNIY